MKIHTHFNVDLDAVASVWAVRQYVEGASEAAVEFHPANWDGVGMADDDIAVDIDAGGTGIKGKQEDDGTIRSCFQTLITEHAPFSDWQALVELVRFIDAHDAHGSVAKHFLPEAERYVQDTFTFTGLNAVLRALQATHPRNDVLVVERMSEIFSGMLKAGRARQRAKEEAKAAEILGGKVAICRDNREFATNGVLFDEYGVRVIIYVDGHNLGIIRHSDEKLRMDDEAFRSVVKAAGETKDWFAHPAGFLFCRGSRKAPADSPSVVDPRDLAAAAVRLLG